MAWNLERVLFWYAVATTIALVASIIYVVLPFGNANHHQYRMSMGLIYAACEFLIIGTAYLFSRAKLLIPCLVLMAIWLLAKLSAALWRLLDDSLSLWTVSVFVGQLWICSIIVYFAFLEIQRKQTA